MTERASVFEGVQIGAETTPGTAVAASKRLLSLMVDPAIKPLVSVYRGRGGKHPTVTAQQREWVEASVSGPLSYTDLIYPLSSVLKAVSPTGAGAGKTWVMALDPNGPDTHKTYTVEMGSSVRAMKFAYGLFTGLTLNFGPQECTLQGTMIGQNLTDGITLTSTPATVAMVPVAVPEVACYLADTQAGLAGATALTRFLSGSWAITNRYGPVWAINKTAAAPRTFVADVELAPTIEARLLLAADATGMGLLTTMQANATKWLRFKAASAVEAETGIPYSLTIDGAFRVRDVAQFRDEGGVFAIEWTLEGIADPTWAKALEATLVTTVTAL